MTIGIPQFVGARLKEAREARGLTISSLAGSVGVSKQAVSQYENGKASPSVGTMSRIARALDMPVRFFLTRVTPGDQTDTIFYRSMSAATKGARTRAERHYGWLRRVVTWLTEYVTFPAVRFPDFGVTGEAQRIGFADIEHFALELRNHWGLECGPIPSVTAVLEDAGAILARMELHAATLDAFSEWRTSEHRPYLVLGADKASAVRSRYDASHEIGHMILHRHLAPGMLRNASVFRLVEEQAHHFAGAFLLPATAFADDLYVLSLETLVALKAKWHVSIAAMLKRATQLDLVAPDRARRMWRSLTRRGWRAWEPLDDELPIEEPVLVKRSFDLLFSKNLVVPAAIEAHLGIGLSDVEQVCGLPQGYLDQGPRPVMRFRR